MLSYYLLSSFLTSTNNSIGTNTEKLVVRALSVYSKKRELDYITIHDYQFVSDSTGEINQIDILYLSNKGLFVIEVKCWKGIVFGNQDDMVWTIVKRYGRKRVTTSSLNPMIQNQNHKEYLLDKIGELNIPIYDVVVFVSNNIDRYKYPNVIWYKDLFRYLDGKEVNKDINKDTLSKLFDKLEEKRFINSGNK